MKAFIKLENCYINKCKVFRRTVLHIDIRDTEYIHLCLTIERTIGMQQVFSVRILNLMDTPNSVVTVHVGF
jgi:hypothetical protein